MRKLDSINNINGLFAYIMSAFLKSFASVTVSHKCHRSFVDLINLSIVITMEWTNLKLSSSCNSAFTYDMYRLKKHGYSSINKTFACFLYMTSQ